MFRLYLKSFKQNKSRYISWNILFLWGFGLWIALCTNNIYHSYILKQQDLEIEYNISMKTEIVEDMLYTTTTNYTFCNMILMLKTMLQYVYVFASVSFIIVFACSHEYFEKVTEIWNNMVCNFYSVILYFTILARSCKNGILDKSINKYDTAILKSKVVTNSGISIKYSRIELSDDNEERKRPLEDNKNKNISNTNIHIVQNEIAFSTYTLLLFNNCELYQYFNNQQLKNHLLTRCILDQSSEYLENNRKILNNYKRHDNHVSKKVIERGIVSSSPEFQKFLENLKKSQYFYPYMLEISTSYMIRIKSIYK